MICPSQCRVAFMTVLVSWVGENSHFGFSSIGGSVSESREQQTVATAEVYPLLFVSDEIFLRTRKGSMLPDI